MFSLLDQFDAVKIPYPKDTKSAEIAKKEQEFVSCSQFLIPCTCCTMSPYTVRVSHSVYDVDTPYTVRVSHSIYDVGTPYTVRVSYSVYDVGTPYTARVSHSVYNVGTPYTVRVSHSVYNVGTPIHCACLSLCLRHWSPHTLCVSLTLSTMLVPRFVDISFVL